MAELTKKQKKLLEELTAGTYKAPSEQRREKRDANLRKQQAEAKTEDIAPIKTTQKESWFNTGRFKDGWQFGDLTKTIIGTGMDIKQDFIAGGIGIGEKAVDFGAHILGGGAKLIGQDKFADKMENFIKKDLINEEESASRVIATNPSGAISNAILGISPFKAKESSETIEESSVLGTKADSLTQSAGQLAGTIGLQSVGVPWQVTTGATSFGAESEQAFKNDATWGEATFSATVSAGAEVLAESLFKIPGISASGSGKLGNKLVEKLSKDMSQTVTRNLMNYGINALGEGFEEVATSFFQNLGQVLSYEREETLQELVENEDARDTYVKQVIEKQFGEEARQGYLDSAIGGVVLSAGGGAPALVSANKAGVNLNSGLTDAEEQTYNRALEQALKDAEQTKGKKLSSKEKAVIEDNLKQQIINERNIPTAEDLDAQIEEKIAEQEQTQDRREKEIIQDEIDILQEEKQAVTPVEQKTQSEQTAEAKKEAEQIVADIERNLELEQQAQTVQEQQQIRNKITELENQLAPLQEQLEQSNTDTYSKEIAELESLKEKYTNPVVQKALDTQINRLKQDSKTELIPEPASQEVAETQSTESLQSITDEDIENNASPMEVDEDIPLSNDVAINEDTTDIKTRIKDSFGLKPREANELYDKVAKLDSVEQVREVLEDYRDINETYESQEIRSAKQYLRTTGIDTSKLKTDHKNELMRSAYGQIKFNKNGLSVDQVYQELSAKYPDLFDPDVANDADQFERIVDFVTSNTIKNTVKVGEISNEDLNKLSEELYAEVHANEFNSDTEYQNSLKDLDNVIDQEALKQEITDELKTQVNDIKAQIDDLKSMLTDTTNTLKDIRTEQVSNKLNEQVGGQVSGQVENTPETNENTEIKDETLQVREDLKEDKTQEIKEHEAHTGMKVEEQDGGAKLTKILTDMPEDIPENKIGEYLETAGIKIIDKGFTVKNEALKFKNQTLEEDYNQIKHANREAVNMAMDGYTEFDIDLSKSRKDGRIKSKKTVKSIEDILNPIKKNNQTEKYYDYMYNQLNIDRMSIESNAQAKIEQMLEADPILKELNKRNTLSQIQKKIVEGITQTNIDEIINQEIFEKNNDLFKSKQLQKEEAQRLRDNVWEIVKLQKAKNKVLLNITAEQSKEHLKQYEGETDFETAQKDTYAYREKLQDILVDAGMLSEEQKAYMNELYPHYIPAYRAVGKQVINVNSFNNNIKPVDAIGKAKGGTQDILPLDHSLMVKTKQVVQSARVNKYLQNLKNTYEKNGILNVISSENSSAENTFEEGTSTERLGKTEAGQYTATVYENGKKTVFEISKGQYEALKPSDIPVITTLNTFVDIKRSLLTQYNLYFATRNFLRDMPTAFLQSQDSLNWLKNVPEAVMQVAKKGEYWQLAQTLGAGNNDYADMNNIGYGDISPIDTNADHKGNKFSRGWEAVKDWKGVKWIATINNFIEQVPRMAEFITAIDSGKSGAGAIYAQDEVTVNFGKGGDAVKTLDRNVTNFVNANIQGLYKTANVFRDAYAYDGKKGLAKTISKYVLAGGSMVALMEMAWGDDEEYEELSDYIKQNYYVLGKYGDGKFIKIPKGRTNAVIEDIFNEGISVLKGEKTIGEASKDFMAVVSNNMAPNSLVESSIFAGIYQTLTNTSWYGEDIVPVRLQKEEAKDQYDEKIDSFSIWLGQQTGLSPYKINYLLDQSTGFLGDMILPLLTEQAETPIDNPVGELLLGQFYKDYTGDSTMKNQNITDIYELTDEGSDLYVDAHKSDPDTDSIMKYKYLTTATARMNELYKEKRVIQAETGLTNSEKVSALRDVQRQIDDIAKNALDTYENIDKTSSYYSIEGIEYYKNINSDGEVEWKKVNEEELEKLNSLEMDINDKTTYFNAKVGITEIDRQYEASREKLDKERDADKITALSNQKKSSVIDTVMKTNLTDKQKEYLYTKYYSTEETVDKILDKGTSMNTYLQFEKDTIGFEADKNEEGKSISGSKTNKYEEYLLDSNLSDNDKRTLYEYSVLGDFESEDKHKDYKIIKTAGVDIDSYLSYASQTFTADKYSNGKTVSGSRKNKVFDYINSLNLSVPQKAIMFKAEYNSEDSYNNQIIDYVDTLDISYEEKIKLVTDIGMKVDKKGRIWW